MGKSYTNYAQARQRFMGPAFKRAAGGYILTLSGRRRNIPKTQKSSVLSGMPLKPETVTLQFDTAQVSEALRKAVEAMAKSGKTFKILADAITDAIVKGVEAVVCFSGHHVAIDSYLQYEKRWIMLQALDWIQDPEGGLVSPHTLDIVDPAILDHPHEFKRFFVHYLATGKVGEWVPCWYAVPAVEQIALPLDSLRKQLEERITE